MSFLLITFLNEGKVTLILTHVNIKKKCIFLFEWRYANFKIWLLIWLRSTRAQSKHCVWTLDGMLKSVTMVILQPPIYLKTKTHFCRVHRQREVKGYMFEARKQENSVAMYYVIIRAKYPWICSSRWEEEISGYEYVGEEAAQDTATTRSYCSLRLLPLLQCSCSAIRLFRLLSEKKINLWA